MPLPDGESEILTQAEAFRLMGVSRAVGRGFLDRGELTPVDHNGVKGSARLARADVLHLVKQRGLPAPLERATAVEVGECPRCSALERKVAELHSKLAQAKKMIDTIFPT
jgi:hypothetical protein